MSKETDQLNAMLDAAAGAGTAAVQPWTPELIRNLVFAVLLFTLFALILASVLLWRHSARGELVLKLFGLITIIGLSAVLLVAGYSNDQLTPIVGLFGAIAGYLLGKDSPPTREPPAEKG